MKKVWIATLCAALVITLSLGMRNREYSRTEYMMDTVITITANDKAAVDDCFAEIKRLENLFSTFIPESDVSRINASALGEEIKISPETAELIGKALEYKKVTDGAFDISIKPVADLWDIKGGGYVPDDVQIRSALSLIGDVELDIANNTVALTKEGMQIDLGGIAKGYTGDRVRQILEAHGVKSAIADLGGNIVAVGKNGKRPWKVGLQKPDSPRGTTFATVSVEDKTVVTSGGYERFFEKDGQAYHHIFDPETGENPTNGVLGVTIVADDGALADALSTACFVKGADDAVALAEKCGVHVALYMDDGTVKTTDNLELEKEEN